MENFTQEQTKELERLEAERNAMLAVDAEVKKRKKENQEQLEELKRIEADWKAKEHMTTFMKFSPDEIIAIDLRGSALCIGLMYKILNRQINRVYKGLRAPAVMITVAKALWVAAKIRTFSDLSTLARGMTHTSVKSYLQSKIRGTLQNMAMNELVGRLRQVHLDDTDEEISDGNINPICPRPVGPWQ